MKFNILNTQNMPCFQIGFVALIIDEALFGHIIANIYNCVFGSIKGRFICDLIHGMIRAGKSLRAHTRLLHVMVRVTNGHHRDSYFVLSTPSSSP